MSGRSPGRLSGASDPCPDFIASPCWPAFGARPVPFQRTAADQGAFMADTVLVTGGSGFIGSHLSRMLIHRGDKVINFDLSRRGGPLAWMLRAIEQDSVYAKGSASNLTQLIALLRQRRPKKIEHL